MQFPEKCLILVHFGQNLVPQIFLWVLRLVDVAHCFKLSLQPISRKTNETNLKKKKKSEKPYFGHKFGPQKFFFRILPLLDVRH